MESDFSSDHGNISNTKPNWNPFLSYKVYTNIGQTVLTTKRFAVVLDKRAGFSGVGSSFIRLHDFPEATRRKVNKQNDVPKFRNESGKKLPIVGTIELFVQIGTSTQIV